MIKELLKDIVFIEDNKIKKCNTKTKNKNHRTNSVLNNYLFSKKIKLIKKPKETINEKARNLKIININRNNNPNSNSFKKLTEEKEPNTHILTDSGIANKQYVYTENNSFRTNNSYSVKIKNELSREKPDIKSINVEEIKNNYHNSLNHLNNSNDSNEKQFVRQRRYIGKNFDGISNIDEQRNENGNGKKIKTIKNILLKDEDDNKIFINNLEKEFEIRCLKKKLEILKKNNISLTQKYNDIMKKNFILKNETSKEQNKRTNIICSTINVCKKYAEKNIDEEKSNYKNLLLNIMDKKYHYDNMKLNNFFFNGLKELLLLSSPNKNIYNNNDNSIYKAIYTKVNDTLGLKNKYTKEIKAHKEQNKENEKYYNYYKSLCQKLNVNDFNSMIKYLTNIRCSNDDERKKIIKMKQVLFDEDKLNKKMNKIRTSEGNLNNRKKGINFNYVDLQNYSTEKKSKNSIRNSSSKSNVSARTEKVYYPGCLTDKANNKNSIKNKILEKSLARKSYDKANYYKITREQLHNYKLDNSGNNLRPIKSFREKILRNGEENDKENNSLYYSLKQKLRNIPYNYGNFKKIEIKKNINKNNNTQIHNIICFNKQKLKKKCINRIRKYRLNLLCNCILSNNSNLKIKFNRKNKILSDKIVNKSDNFFRNNIENSQPNNLDKNNDTYSDIIESKKKTLNLLIPSLKSMKNYRTIIFNDK